MKICDQCKAVFEVPHSKFEDGETVQACPECGGEEYSTAVRCERCKEWSALGGVEHGLCLGCVRVVERRYWNLLAAFTPIEQEYIKAIGGKL